MSERPNVCPTCHVIAPGVCRNEQGQKVYPPHHLRPEEKR